MSETPPPEEPLRPSPQAVSPPAQDLPPAAAPVAFPQVLRTPWINPAKRTQFSLLAIVAALIIAVAAFLGGIAAGGGDHGGRERRGPIGFYACGQVNRDCGGPPFGRMNRHKMMPRSVLPVPGKTEVPSSSPSK